uniref:RNA pseudouridine synthase D3 n=1 Tax=Erpetoichthys calabaricus TaxID=27687 RepID=A0A8C4TJ64_ERPCA
MRHLFRFRCALSSRRWIQLIFEDPKSSRCPEAHLYSTVTWYHSYLQKASPKYRQEKKIQRVNILQDPGIPIVDRLSRNELIELLKNSIVYREGALLALSKPCGLSITGQEPSLNTLLPDLRKALCLSETPHIVTAAQRDLSGLVLLSNCHQTTRIIEAAILQARKAQIPVATYWAVTVGTLHPSEGEIKMPLKISRIHERQLVIPAPDPAPGNLQRKEVKKAVTRYRVLDSAEGCSLVQLQPLSTFQDQLRVHLSVKLSPALGDHVYSSRVGCILGVPISLPVDSVEPHPQVGVDKIQMGVHLTFSSC